MMRRKLSFLAFHFDSSRVRFFCQLAHRTGLLEGDDGRFESIYKYLTFVFDFVTVVFMKHISDYLATDFTV